MASNALAPTNINALTAQNTTPPAVNWPARPTAKERFLQSRDTTWADKYGGVTPYYPQQRYITENLAPNLNITNQDIEALAQAQQIARKNKTLSPALLDAMLPTLLTEGKLGINSWGYPDTPKYRDILIKSGLDPATVATGPDTNDPYELALFNAKRMHALMAAKESEYGSKLAIERWNGKGTNKLLGADAKNHARKVQELTQLLQHPKNEPIASRWKEMNSYYAGGGTPLKMTPPPEPSYWEDSLPGVIGVPINAIRNWLTK
jgi:hypothetical protein